MPKQTTPEVPQGLTPALNIFLRWVRDRLKGQVASDAATGSAKASQYTTDVATAIDSIRLIAQSAQDLAEAAMQAAQEQSSGTTVLQPATSSTLGGVIVGSGLDVDSSGTLSVGSAYVTSGGVSSIAGNVVSSVVSSAGFVTSSGASAIVSGYVDAGGYVTSSGVVSVVDSVILSGGYATSAYVSSAVADKITTSQALDAVSSAGYATSSNVSSIAGDLIASSAYVLPTATTSSLGGVIVGSGLDVDSSGTVSVGSAYALKATTLSGYGVTDAYISSGVITLGAVSITPITSIVAIPDATINALS